MVSGKHQGLKRLEQMALRTKAYKVFLAGESLERLGDEDWQSFINEDKRYAVRSSYRGEDGSIDSFAGVFDSILDVGASDLADAILQVIRSAETDNAREYARNKGLPIPSGANMDVICQEMVDADISALLFTANPRGMLHEAVLEAAFGLGEDLVNGNVPVQRYIYYYEGAKIYHSSNVDAPYLAPEILEELSAFLDRYYRQQGPPVDIEIAIEEGTIYYLQIRPITTVDIENTIVLDNSNIVESYPGISLPLSIDFAHTAYRGVFQQLGRRILGPKLESEAVWNNLSAMVEDYQGRIYYRISNWYQVLAYLPFHKKLIAIWQDMLGVQNKALPKSLKRVPWYKKLLIFPRFMKVFLSVPMSMLKLSEDFKAIEKSYRARSSKLKSKSEILALFQTLKAQVLENWDITLFNDLYAFFYTWLYQQTKPGKRRELQVTGKRNLASMEPLWAAQHLSKLEPGTESFALAKADFINRFGDRSLEELKLETKTFRSHPETLDDLLEQLRQGDISLSPQQALDDDTANMSEPRLGLFARRWYKRAIDGIAYRESSRLNRSRIYGIVRDMAWAMGELLLSENRLEKAEDVFYLTLDEMFANNTQDWQAIVEARKLQYQRYRQMPAYPRLIFAGEIVQSEWQPLALEEKHHDARIFSGTALSQGIIEGEIYVVRSVAEAKSEDLRGKILVTQTTDPAWAYLLIQAKGLISEKGSLLSHTGIIARELKIPCIAGLQDATSIFTSGQRVRLDGNLGQVEILE